MSGIILQRSPFLDGVTGYVQKALLATPDKDLLIIVGWEFHKRFKDELEKQSGHKIDNIEQFMAVDYEVSGGILPDKMFVIRKKDYRSKIMVVQ